MRRMYAQQDKKNRWPHLPPCGGGGSNNFSSMGATLSLARVRSEYLFDVFISHKFRAFAKGGGGKK